MSAMVDRLGADRLRQWLPLATLVVLVILVGTLQPVFLQPATLLQLASDTAVLFILATGVTFVIMLGGIDLSIQSMASLASVIVALTVARLGYGAFALAIALGVAGRAAFRPRPCPAEDPVLHRDAGDGRRALQLRTGHLRASARSRWRTPSASTRAGSPAPCSACRMSSSSGSIVLVVAHVLQSHTRFGRYSAAIGAGEPAAYASGVKVGRQKIFAFVLSGGFAALAGVVLAGRLASGSPTLAAELLLPSIAAVVVGGTAITGGVGSIWRTLVGALIISVVRIGMTFLGVNIFAQNIVFGVVLIAAVAITIDRSKIPIVK